MMTYQVSDTELSMAMDRYAEIYRQVATFESVLENLKGIIKEGTVERGQSVSHTTPNGEVVTAKYRNGYERVSWKKEPLLKLAETTPEILDCMSVSQVSPSLAGITVAQKV
jgi:hypothetical protein